MDHVVCAAIRGRDVVRFTYGGGSRTAELYCHGTSTAGNEVVRAYQTGGFSESGQPVGWKLFEVAAMRGVQPTGATVSGVRSGYHRGDSAMLFIHCRV